MPTFALLLTILLAVPPAPAPISDTLPNFSDCSAAQEDIVSWVVREARAKAAIAAVGLRFLPEPTRPASARTAKWFGAYDKARFEAIRDSFYALSYHLNNSKIEFDCGTCPSPHSSRFAYSYPDRPFAIYLCGAFFTQPDTGAGSKVATVIHEMSHFTIVAGTDDFASGATACELFAKSDPARAARNADNFAFFAENEPYVPLRPDEPPLAPKDPPAPPRDKLPPSVPPPAPERKLVDPVLPRR